MRLLISVLCAFLVVSCGFSGSDIQGPASAETETVTPITAFPLKNYYLKNKTPSDHPAYFYVFDDKKTFDFQLGASKGAAGTPVNFARETAILMILSPSQTSRKIVVDQVYMENGNVKVFYHVEEGKAISWSMPTVHMFKIAKPEQQIFDFVFIGDAENEIRVPLGARVAGSPKSLDDLRAHLPGPIKAFFPVPAAKESRQP